MAKKIIILFILSITIFCTQYLFGARADQGAGTGNDSTKTTPACPGDGTELCNPLKTGGVESPQQLIGKVIIAALGIVGSLALLMFIYGGFTWMMAAGNQEQVTKGRNILIWATIGLIVIFSSYALVRFVFQGVGAIP